ncbi:regulatory protein spx [Enterococcus sp. DIV0765f]|uniref:Spx/MgsR family RNA polymerase-binding regulatory protein n=1 Tax=Enterococcus sp. DIV0765f TaxID=2774783 RepID=UPI003F23288D
MIVIYTSTSSLSCRNTVSWFRVRGIPFIERKLNKQPLTSDELKNILLSTCNGFDDIIAIRSKLYKKIQKDFENYTFEEAFYLILNNSSLIKKPIIMEGKRIAIGYSEDKLIQFIPKNIK